MLIGILTGAFAATPILDVRGDSFVSRLQPDLRMPRPRACSKVWYVLRAQQAMTTAALAKLHAASQIESLARLVSASSLTGAWVRRGSNGAATSGSGDGSREEYGRGVVRWAGTGGSRERRVTKMLQLVVDGGEAGES